MLGLAVLAAHFHRKAVVVISHGAWVVRWNVPWRQASRVVVVLSMSVAPPKPVVLMILDGWGNGPDRDDNAVTRGHCPRIRALRAAYPSTLISASGPDVGLPVGQMGNSEVGHLNLGAGRIASTDLSRIDNAVASGTLGQTPAIAAALRLAKQNTGTLHLVGLLSDGGVHSSLDHWLALVDIARAEHVPVLAHLFLDGRDVAPGSAGSFVRTLEARLAGAGSIASVGGRFYGMDRDNRWERIETAYRAVVDGHAAQRFSSAESGIADALSHEVTDEFVIPFVVGSYEGMNTQSDVMLHVNFRPDRAREFSHAVFAEDFVQFARPRGPCRNYVCMTEYDAKLGAPIAYLREDYHDTLGEVVARAGMKQLRCAETEKYAHVTYFFSGGREELFEGEDRRLVPSPKDVQTYDEKPEMSAAAVTDVVVAAIEGGEHELIVVNYANPDMVGHTGNLQAAMQAVAVIDASVSRVVDALLARGGELLLTADHGNCEQMVDPVTGLPFTAHTTNLVDLTLVSDHLQAGAHLLPGGKLGDIAPTILARLGLPQPALMTGQNLLAQP